MATHMWGDKDFDWKSLNDAQDTLYFWGKKVGRNAGQLKDKFGEIRWYCNPGGAERLYDLTHPGYAGYWWGSDVNPFMYFVDNLSYTYIRPFKPLIRAYKRFFYAYAYHKAVKKFPELYPEILSCCEADELLFKRERKLYQSLWAKSEDDADVC